jgi:hypothetical protein
MSAPILLQPLPQFCDANGRPYAGGSITTYVRGTTTPKTTWKDPDQAAVNTNPITLDAAGQCSMWGDGDYQLELHDAAGTLIWSAPSTTVVSAAMYPVVSAPTTTDAMNALGVPAAIATAVAAEAAARSAEIASATGAVQANLDASNAAQAEWNATAAEVSSNLAAYDLGLQAQISALAGSPVEVAHGGTAVLTFGIGSNFATYDITFPPFASATHAVVVTCADTLWLTAGLFSNIVFSITNLTNGGARINATGLGGTAAAAFNTTVYWVATGS